MARLRFDAGTLLLGGLTEAEGQELGLPFSCQWDRRTECFRAPAQAYADLVLTFTKLKRPLEDEARAYAKLELAPQVEREPRPFQVEALSAWKRAQGRGVVVLPTGSGKSHMGCMAILDKQRSAMVVAPTLDLVRQWYDSLRVTFGVPVGVLGGGEHDIQNLTVATYDSAAIHMDHLGARFGLIIFDECHHLPGPTYSLAAKLCLAPYRLGLTATPERQDGKESLLTQLVGPIVYEKAITELSGSYLADYDTERVQLLLSESERAEYEAERRIYTQFLRTAGVTLRQPSDWNDFIIRSSRSPEGRRAMQAYRRQKELATAAPAKLQYLQHLLRIHSGDQILIFTHDNRTAYKISRDFLIPVITHQTKTKERSRVLELFSNGTYDAIVTSKVLNEGVDVPDASVAVVMSGSGSVREHVQRLGRILRKKAGKRAILYELVTQNTGEGFTSERRRDHLAYGD
ncbi:MAG: DEAD/DEAH box helicase family protein [Polyangiaceae bacterium]|nr:DEAD/DEAH box helicase family protein [Polyangiaceae bacterium]